MTEAEILQTMRRLKFIARAMDAAWQVPFTNFRFGLDPLIGLLPVGGDAVDMAISLYIVQQARKLGVPQNLIMKMLLNVAIETGAGLFPVVGGAFDAMFKANIRNYNLLAEFLKQKGIRVPA